jgi:hypothetical protein
MPTTPPKKTAIGAELSIAALLLVGILIVAYGYFQHTKVALYAGLLVTAVGVMLGVVRIVARAQA